MGTIKEFKICRNGIAGGGKVIILEKSAALVNHGINLVVGSVLVDMDQAQLAY
jgi:hypothetical protein